MGCLHRLWIGAIWLWSVFPAGSPAAETGVGFLVPRDAAESMNTECDMAREVAERQMSAVAFLPGANGLFVDRNGRDVSLERFRAVWCHIGDTAQPQAPAFDPQTVAALRQFVSGGRGLWLSGRAVTLLESLGLDTLRAQVVPTAQDSAEAGLVPAAASHPAFHGLDLDQGVLWMSNAAFPAFAEFRLLSQPAKGMILARCPGGPDCPLGRIPGGPGPRDRARLAIEPALRPRAGCVPAEF